MSKAIYGFLSVASLGCGLTGCAMAPVQTAEGYASQGANLTYHAATTGAHVVYATGGDVYSGVGTAAKQPFRDLNMMQDPIPLVLIRAEASPYDIEGLDSCDAILNKVAQLDLALGPDLDSPKDHGRSRTSHTASMAAVAALDAASSAAEGFLPMRSVIKQVSGAARYDNHVKHAVLAGTVRRGFLKAVGMQHNCGWPASPLGFRPVIVAIETAPLTVPPVGDHPSVYASVAAIQTARPPISTRSRRRAGHGRAAPPSVAALADAPAPPAAAAGSNIVGGDSAPANPERAIAKIASASPTSAVATLGRGVAISQDDSDLTQAPARSSFATKTPVYPAALSPSASFAAPWTGSPNR